MMRWTLHTIYVIALSLPGLAVCYAADLDGKHVTISEAALNELPTGKHKVRFKVLNPTDEARLYVGNAITYGETPVKHSF